MSRDLFVKIAIVVMSILAGATIGTAAFKYFNPSP